MSTIVAAYPIQPSEVQGENGTLPEKGEGPFASTAGQAQRPHQHRYSSFDIDQFSINNTTSSREQAKRALEAHLLETDRRLEEASKLGTALVQQRKEISEQLKEVELQQGQREIGPELRQKLIEVEREYHEVGRESARAFLAPKSRLSIADDLSNGYGSDSRVRLLLLLMSKTTN